MNKIVLLFFLVVNSICFGQFGNIFIDSSFADEGSLEFKIGEHPFIASILKKQSDNKFIIGSNSYIYPFNPDTNYFVMARIFVDGQLDTTFGVNGFVKTKVISNRTTNINCIDISSEGKILLSGTNYDSLYNKSKVFVIYNQNGSLDSSFSDDGVLMTNFNFTNDFSIADVKFYNNEILFAGTCSFFDEASHSYLYPNNIIIGKLNPQVVLDSTYYVNNLKTIYLQDSLISCAAYKIVLFSNNDYLLFGQSGPFPYEKFAKKFMSKGELDSTFGVDGLLDLNTTLDLRDIKILDNNDFLVLLQNNPSILIKYDNNGQQKTDFGINGVMNYKLLDASHESFNTINIDENKNIILTGNSGDYERSGYAYVRLKSNGQIDHALCPQYFYDNPNNSFYEGSTMSIYLGNGKVLFSGRHTIKHESPVDYSGFYTYLKKLDLNKNVNCKYFEKGELLDVYPNPTVDKIQIKYSYNLDDWMQLEIFDMHGVQVLKKEIEAMNSEINLNLNPGLYFYRIYDRYDGKIIKQDKLVVL